ncbi:MULTISPECIES: acyltransferase [unclassified Caballeronia]|uniref:acyltransferase family protein n=1 Tax=unclassified Caballeronia TaxID=2646786 RepID=UPI0028676313|nr:MULTISPECIES: acyltransferase [unclassified Caballeronia]MDR5751321.1 acyltransferase [Caballeronia sp. LZ024]MDR5844537.1 acyltransferase [Caballeronia sp. LZ031]
MKKKFIGLDLLRFALAFYLMIFHSIHEYPQNVAIPFIDLAGLGGFATSSFFLLSGFILSHVYFGQSTELRGGTWAFFVKRLSNLYPIHLIALALLMIVSLSSTRALNQFALMTLEDGPKNMVVLGSAGTAFNFALNLLMLQVWNPLFGSVNPPSWSLSTLLSFYVIFPFAASRLLPARNKGWILIALWVLYLVPPVLASVMKWYGPLAVGIVTRNPLLRLPEFFGGIVLYGLFKEGKLEWIYATRVQRTVGLLFVGVCFALASRVISVGPLYARYLVHNGALMPAEVALIVLCARVTVPTPFERISVTLGNSALSIFAIHVPLFMVLIKVVKLFSIGESPVWCATNFASCVSASKEVIPSMATYPLYLVGTVFVAVYFQERLVNPMRNLIRRRLLAKTKKVSNEAVSPNA